MLNPFIPDEVRDEVETYLPTGRATLEQVVAAVRDQLRPGADVDMFVYLAQVLGVLLDPTAVVVTLATAIIDLAKRPIDVGRPG